MCEYSKLWLYNLFLGNCLVCWIYVAEFTWAALYCHLPAWGGRQIYMRCSLLPPAGLGVSYMGMGQSLAQTPFPKLECEHRQNQL